MMSLQIYQDFVVLVSAIIRIIGTLHSYIYRRNAFENDLSGCYPGNQIYCNIEADFSDNVLLPYSGDYQAYCDAGGIQDGVVCDDGNGMIDESEDCECVTESECDHPDYVSFFL